jgi:hypothetical protein
MAFQQKKELTARQEAAVLALLSEGTLERSAEVARVGVTTLKRWLKDEAFAAALKAARRRRVEESTWELQGVVREAVAALRRALSCGKPGTEVRAALGVLDRAWHGLELTDLAARVEELERQLKGGA